MSEQETHEAVVKLARGELEAHERINCWFRPEFVRALIDRLDAAHKREIEATAAKMREALEAIVDCEKRYDYDLLLHSPYWDGSKGASYLGEAVDIARAALDRDR